VVNEPVRFLKIDVQGGEGAVLRGAQSLVNRDLIDIIFIEFQGESDVVEFIEESGFSVFDIEYNAIAVGVSSQDLGFLPGYKDLPLSNGSIAVRGRIADIPRDTAELGKFMTEWRPKKGYLWTDLVLVRGGFVDEFHAALDASGVPR
jgi:hypothetical protein